MTTTNSNTHKEGLSNWVIGLGILIIVLLMAFPLATITDSEFGGADGLGSETAAEIAPEYDSEWITNVWAPPGGETESMLFAVQAAVGGILMGYVFGYLRGRAAKREEDDA